MLEILARRLNMATTRVPSEIIDNLTQVTQQFSKNLDTPIREQQAAQEKIIRIAMMIEKLKALLASNPKIQPGSEADKQIRAFAAEISAPASKLEDLLKTWESSIAKVNANAASLTQTKLSLEQIRQHLKIAKEYTNPTDLNANILKKTEEIFTKLSTAVDNANAVLGKQEEFKTKIPEVVKKAQSNIAGLQEKLKALGLTQTVYAANVSVTLHGNAQPKPAAATVNNPKNRP